MNKKILILLALASILFAVSIPIAFASPNLVNEIDTSIITDMLPDILELLMLSLLLGLIMGLMAKFSHMLPSGK